MIMQPHHSLVKVYIITTLLRSPVACDRLPKPRMFAYEWQTCDSEYDSNSQLTSWVVVNAQVHHIEGQERKINKSNNMIIINTTSSQCDKGLHHHNTSKMSNFVYYTLVMHCVIMLRGEEGGER